MFFNENENAQTIKTFHLPRVVARRTIFDDAVAVAASAYD